MSSSGQQPSADVIGTTDDTADRESAPAPEETQSNGADNGQVELLNIERNVNGQKLELDDLFDLLKNQRRRWVIKILEAKGGTSTLDYLAETIAAKENQIDKAMISSSQRKRVYIGLYQCHLPKMDKMGVIEYDKNRGTIELQDISQLEPYLEHKTQTETVEPHHYEHVVGTAVGVLVLVAVTSPGPLAVISSGIWGGVAAITLIAIVLFQQWQRGWLGEYLSGTLGETLSNWRQHTAP